MIVAGIMSGTSLDGIDVALVEIRGRRVQTLRAGFAPYDEETREALLGVSNCTTHTRDIARLHFLLPELYAEAVKAVCRRAKIGLEKVRLVGCHGQTIYHEGEPAAVLGRRVASTLQIGDGAVLAERLGIPVVCDFRPRDIAAGGKGAPLVPFADYHLFAHPRRGRVVLNIGGIANITVLPAGCQPGEVIAFDTGPGNMVIDQLAARLSGGKLRCDPNGRLAARAEPDAGLLRALLQDPYYRRRPPKTAGREQFGAEFVERICACGLSMEQALASATALTARSIGLAVERYGAGCQELIASGGGVHNTTLMRLLAEAVPGRRLLRSSELGVDADAKEAIAFAVLAHETWRGRPANLPSATGARRAVVLGKIVR